MGVKTTIRLMLEKMIGKFGYTMVRNHELEKYRVVIDQEEILFDKEAFEKRDPNRYTVGLVDSASREGIRRSYDSFRTIGI